MILKLETDATAEPVTLDEMKNYLRLSTASTIDDVLLSAMVKTARVAAETRTHQAFMPQTWKLYIDDFPGSTGAITLPIGPLSSSASDVVITYIEESSRQSTTLPATAYTCDSDDAMGRLYPRYGTYDNEWPDNVMDRKKAVTVQFRCGFPLSSSSGANTNIEPVKQWIKVRVSQMYENRGAYAEGRMITEFGRDYIDGLLDPYVLPEVY